MDRLRGRGLGRGRVIHSALKLGVSERNREASPAV